MGDEVTQGQGGGLPYKGAGVEEKGGEQIGERGVGGEGGEEQSVGRGEKEDKTFEETVEGDRLPQGGMGERGEDLGKKTEGVPVFDVGEVVEKCGGVVEEEAVVGLE